MEADGHNNHEKVLKMVKDMGGPPDSIILIYDINIKWTFESLYPLQLLLINDTGYMRGFQACTYYVVGN